MDSFEFNKVAMAVLATVFAIFGVSIVSEAIFHSDAPEERAYIIAEIDDGDGGEDAADSGPAFDPVTPLLASADPQAGESVFKKCVSCHTVEEGGANKVGPNLWNIINRQVASDSEFSYSAALSQWGADKQWDWEHMNGFLWKPKTYVSGTAMGFAGLRKVEERADVIAYLRTLSNAPAPLPAPEAEEVAGTDDPQSGDAGQSGEGTGEMASEPEQAGENGADEGEATQTPDEPAATE